MAISSSPENLDHKPNILLQSDLSFSVRMRPNSNVANATPDSSSTVGTLAKETKHSAIDSAAETSSNVDRNRIGNNGEDRLEEVNSLSNGVVRSERIGNGETDGHHADVLLRFSYRASSPAHRRVKESPLSSDAIFRQNHAGLFNLCILVLVAVNSRLIIENLLKYGLLIRAGFWFSSKSLRDWPLLMCCLSLPIFPLGAFMVEKLAQHKFIPETVVVSLDVLICMASILYPVFVILRCDSAVLFGIVLALFACIVWAKLVSYVHTNYDMRALTKSTDKPRYPRTTCIRKGWVARQVVKLVIFTGVMSFIVEQYINPIVQNSQHPLKGNLLYAIERVLKLSVPTLYVWLCMFYCFFHLWLNILAELLCFGDREFYKDWWNAKTVEEYWRMWNMPVHKWMVRHIYFPCILNGIPREVAIVIVFFVSAIFHELCIGVPCHISKFWAFMGIMFQIPLVLFTNYLQNKFRNTMVGNMIFWFFFSILGQPMCVLLYYHDVMNRKRE